MLQEAFPSQRVGGQPIPKAGQRVFLQKARDGRGGGGAGGEGGGAGGGGEGRGDRHGGVVEKEMVEVEGQDGKSARRGRRTRRGLAENWVKLETD